MTNEDLLKNWLGSLSTMCEDGMKSLPKELGVPIDIASQNNEKGNALLST